MTGPRIYNRRIVPTRSCDQNSGQPMCYLQQLQIPVDREFSTFRQAKSAGEAGVGERPHRSLNNRNDLLNHHQNKRGGVS